MTKANWLTHASNVKANASLMAEAMEPPESNIVLSERDSKKFYEDLMSPPKPNSVLKKAADDYTKAIEEGLVKSTIADSADILGELEKEWEEDDA